MLSPNLLSAALIFIMLTLLGFPEIESYYNGSPCFKKHLAIILAVSEIIGLLNTVFSSTHLGPVCLLESSFLLENEFRESELLSDVW